MRYRCGFALLAIALSSLGAIDAQARTVESGQSGPFAGLALGAVNHHFVVEESSPAGLTRSFNVGRWGIAGQAFAGYDLALSDRLLVGV